MAKVTNPLGSEEAHGAVGKKLIFQGTQVKIYRVPRYEPVAAQQETNGRFQGVNKTMRAMKSWGRAVLQNYFGVNWLASSYRAIISYWAVTSAAWDALDAGLKADWLYFSPLENPTFDELEPSIPCILDRGLLFYVCVAGLNQYMIDNGKNKFGFFVGYEINAPDARGWWEDLGTMFGAGVHDFPNESVNLDGFEVVEDAEAYGGAFYQSTGQFDSMMFYFIGTRLGILYKQEPSNAILHVLFEDGTFYDVSQADAETLYQAQWQSAVMNGGLHQAVLSRSGADGPVNVDAIVVYR